MNPRTTLWIPAATLALLSMGCSDPAPTPAAVGLTLSVHAPFTSIPDSTCPSTGQSSIGNPAPNENPLDPGTRIQDGKSGVNVDCAVKGSSSFTVSAGITQGALNFRVSGGKIDTATKSGTFNLNIFTPYADNLASEADRPCTFDIMDAPLEASPGNLFALYNCPALWNREMSPHTACGADGVLVLEFCAE